ncbi:tRNA uridine-5-carboxymethylaminomethyl(34) synthesis enzyme MnmG [Candidatus Nasuia deltocephalinicola]|uniref:tRNA uridine-5-carboxymethylaminomethyl(34) synthesis enzyme MnmG n=1 Tax=Candidatus Nasuia deltocephalincola TaxID=1160784 RepID=UPI00216B2827|nr:tRNA uridine-5-carboxymethylaminomethyl(34) synthesis enzyme MnmG [Candidatus Nasuia deltocephalinicola]
MKDIIIVGAGHAGFEAASILSKTKNKILIITKNINNIGELSCNPSIGGLGKSNLVREVDSLGGYIGYLATKSSIQLKKISTSKGEAVQCTRSQINRKKYKKNTKLIFKKKNIKILQDEVLKLIIKNNIVVGVKTKNNSFLSKAVILTTGTFLNGKIHIGSIKYEEGRINEKNSSILSKQLNYLIEPLKKLKTGTSPRISFKNVKFKNLKEHRGDSNPIPTLSERYKISKNYKNMKCWTTKTTEKTKEIVKKSLKISPMYKNVINGNSPRYCPSIEDKIYRFYNNKKHNIFLEPDENNQIYLGGVSTCLNYKFQRLLLKSIIGLESCEITRLGYSVEYDFLNPKNLKKSLESKTIKGLFFAGQINGTTGYEEAAGQGVVAGINSYLYVNKKKYWYPNKKNSYIGLMINDLTVNGVTEPYRIFTKKNENKLNFREDNSSKRFFNVLKNLKFIMNFNLLKYKKQNINNLINNININKNIIKQIYLHFKYKSYIKIQNFSLKKKKNIKNFKLMNINFFKIKNLSKEVSEKLNKEKPKNIKDILKIKTIKNDSFKIILNYFKKLI